MSSSTTSSPSACAGELDEALERLHRTGPEFEGWLSNHGPMVVEAMSRRGRVGAIHRWVDEYAPRLDELPRSRSPIAQDDWQHALADPTRLGDWVAFFTVAVTEQPWQQVLAQWWPRLLPGIAAGATHGVIRVGHATRALRSIETSPRAAELAHALGYWAARWQPVSAVATSGTADVTRLVATVPRIADQSGGIRDRLPQLDATSGWSAHVASLAPVTVEEVPTALNRLVDSVVRLYPGHAHGQPTMLVHAATAPNAVAMTLPSLPTDLWVAAHDMAWTASAAVLASYLPATAAPADASDTRDAAHMSVDDIFDAAVAHGGEHVVKLADTALRSYERTADPAAGQAVLTAMRLDA